MHWQHPVTGRHVRCQFMVDVGSRAPMITVCEETRERSTRDNQTSECKESLLKGWFVHRGRPRFIRMDPDGCHMSNEMLDTLHHDLGLNTEVIPGEAPWKLSIKGVIMRLVKTNSTHLRVGSGTRRFLSRVSSACCDGAFTSSRTRRIHSLTASSSDTNQLRLKEKRLTMNNKIAVLRCRWPRHWQDSSHP